MFRFIIVAAALVSTAAQGQMRVSPLTDIYESYNDCFVATAQGIDAGSLEARGWVVAQIDGKPSSDPVIFGHADRAPLIILGGSGRDGVCIVTAKLENRSSFDDLITAWGGLKLVKGEASFSANGHPIQIAQTGSEKEPSVRLAVGVPAEKD